MLSERWVFESLHTTGRHESEAHSYNSAKSMLHLLRWMWAEQLCNNQCMFTWLQCKFRSSRQAGRQCVRHTVVIIIGQNMRLCHSERISRSQIMYSRRALVLCHRVMKLDWIGQCLGVKRQPRLKLAQVNLMTILAWSEGSFCAFSEWTGSSQSVVSHWVR